MFLAKTEDYIYLAGIIDGEGTMGIYRNTDRRRRSHSYYYRHNLKVANSCKDLIYWIKGTFGGSIIVYQPRYFQSQISYCWSSNKRQDTIEVLENILPYLKVKRRQAEIVLDFMKSRESINWYPEHEIRKLEVVIRNKQYREYYNEIKKLNSRGHSKKILGEFGGHPKRTIPSRAVEGKGSTEGVTTMTVNPNNNPSQELPARKGRYSLSS